MALVWERHLRGHHYQVRSAGKSVRLYTDGVFHTQYRPNQVLDGSYWDLLSLAALLYPAGTIRRVLVLGVGGGAVIHGLQALVQPHQITGVELDPVHAQIMKRFFSERGQSPLATKGSDPFKNVKVMDARDFIKNFVSRNARKKSAPKFDLIIDDVYGMRDGEPCRAIEVDKAWMTALRRCLARDGMLVCNFTERREFRESLSLAKWQGIYSMTLPAYDNIVGIYVQRRELMMDIESVLKRLAATDKRISAKGLRFRLKKAG